MSQRTLSEALVLQFFAAHGVTCHPVPQQEGQRTPDFIIELATRVVCEVKQIEPNPDDRRDVEELSTVGHGGVRRTTVRWMQNRIRPLLNKSSSQLRRASKEGHPSLLVVYDTTPFGNYTDDRDVLQGLFGRWSVDAWIDDTGETRYTQPYFGEDQGLTPDQNTSVSAVAILRGGPEVATLSLTIFDNPHARVRLDPHLFDGLPVVYLRPA